MKDELDVVKELTIEELKLAAIASDLGGRKRELLKCRYPEGGIFYLVIDDDGGFQADSIEELKEYMGVEE
jgi:hypothetical protein